MHIYNVIEPLTIYPGNLLKLDNDQFQARQYALTKEGDHYRVNISVQFKTGEEIGIDGKLPKNIASLVGEKKPKKKQVEKVEVSE